MYNITSNYIMSDLITLNEDEINRIKALYAVYEEAISSKDFKYSEKYLTIYSGFKPTTKSFHHFSNVESYVDQCYNAARMKNHPVQTEAGTLKVALRDDDNVFSLLANTERQYGLNNFFKNGGSSKKRASTHRRLKSRTTSAARRRNNRRRRTARK